MITLDASKKAEIDAAREKERRESSLSKLTVTTSAGNTYDADRNARAALTTAVSLGSSAMSHPWKMADNSVVEVSFEELREALLLIGEAHTKLLINGE